MGACSWGNFPHAFALWVLCFSGISCSLTQSRTRIICVCVCVFNGKGYFSKEGGKKSRPDMALSLTVSDLNNLMMFNENFKKTCNVVM